MEKKTTIQSYSRKKIASMFIAIGIIVFLSGLIINPWVGKFYRSKIINYHDVMLTYFIWAIVISLLIVGSGLILRSITSKKSENVILFFITCLLIILSDRLLLAIVGLPLWEADVENHYRHRSNIIRSWGSFYNNKLIQLNKYGHQDNDFPLKKADNEFRGLFIGDSITMGQGVTYEETFSNQLEDILRERNSRHRSYQMINTGVQGYSTFQEYNLLMKSFVFKPDFIAVGFCMNDPVEPFVVDKRFGGIGISYHGVNQVSSQIGSYILNETGYGRLLVFIQRDFKSVERAKKWERNSIKKMAQNSIDSPNFSENWKTTLFYLDKIYDAARNQNVKVVLLIFPDKFQLIDDSFQEPQRILINHANLSKIDVIDFTKVFEEIIFDKNITKLLTDNGFQYDDIRRLYRTKIDKYFLERNHYTVEGHRIVASELYKYLLGHYPLAR
jgi:hypothetical protein